MSRSERDCIKRIAALRSGLPGDPVADAGDLALVGHQPGERGARGARRSPRPSAAPGAASWIGERFGPIRPTRPPSGHQPTSMSRHTRTSRRAAADRALDQVEVGAVVDHQHRRPRRVLGGQPRRARRSPPGRPSGRRRRCPRSPRRRGSRASGAVNASTPRKPGSSSRIRRRTAVERTDFEATRIGSPPAWASIAVALRAQRVEVDERERRRDAGEDRVVARLERLAIESRAAGSRRGERI